MTAKRTNFSKEARWSGRTYVESAAFSDYFETPIGLRYETVPVMRALLVYYLIVCAHNEHFLDYRQAIRDELDDRLRDAPSIVAMARHEHVAEAV